VAGKLPMQYFGRFPGGAPCAVRTPVIASPLKKFRRRRPLLMHNSELIDCWPNEDFDRSN